MSQYAGFPGIEELESSPAHSRQNGWTNTRRWRGPRAQMLAFQAFIAQSAEQTRLQSPDSDFPIVEAEFSTAPGGGAAPTVQLNVKWNLTSNQLAKDIFTHPKYLALPPADQTALAAVRKDLDDARRGSIPGTGDAAEFLNLILSKVETYSLFQHVLRRVAIVPRNWNGSVANTNVGKVYADSARLIADEGVPTTLTFTLPAGMWLKLAPSMEQQQDGRWQHTQEFWHADVWSALLYDRVT